MQRISVIDGTVIKADQIDEPLAEEPPRLDMQPGREGN